LFIPIGLAGVWCWKGTVGKIADADGERRDVKGVISDFDKIVWNDRRVRIFFDVNVRTDDSVRAAQRELAKELRARGASVETWHWPKDTPASVNGIDDLLYVWGPERVAFGPKSGGAGTSTDSRNASTDEPGKEFSEDSRPVQYSDD